MRPWAALLLGVLLTLGAACARSAGGEEGPRLWFVGLGESWTADSTALGWLSHRGEPTVEGYLSALLAGPPADSPLRSPIPAGTRLLGWSLDERGVLRVDLSEGYGALAGIDLTLADYCITLTLSQIEGVRRVVITAAGQPLAQRYWQHHAPEQVIFSGAEEEPVAYTAPLCFPRSDGRGLGLEMRVLQLTEDDLPAQRVLLALLDGPRQEGLLRLIPAGTELLELRLDDGVCEVNLSAAFVEGCPPDRVGQELLLYSLVNTLGSLETVSEVALWVEGERLTRYGEVRLPPSLEPDFRLLTD